MMAKREETPDLLGQILGEIPAAPPPAKAEEEKPAGQPTSRPARKQAGKTTRKAKKPAAPPEPADGKVKATFYLAPSTLDALEAGWLQLRRLAGQDERGRVSKSLIVEMSLLAALEELRDKDRESQLASMMASQKDSIPAEQQDSEALSQDTSKTASRLDSLPA